MDISKIVDTGKYPIHLEDKSSPEYTKFVASVKSHFIQWGIVTLPGFLRTDAIAEISRELNSKSDKAWTTDTNHNIYLDDGDSKHGRDHIRNKQYPTKVRSLAYDYIAQESSLRILYNCPDFCEFLRRVLNQPTLYKSADPLGACSINIFRKGDQHAWHFDESAFSTTIMLQKPEQGGLFQLTRPIRGSYGLKKQRIEGDDSEDEEVHCHHFETMSKIVRDGRREEQDLPDLARNLEFEPGTLSIFQGSQCLHRVTQCYGPIDRLVAVLCFSTRKGYKNSPKVQEMFWGRTSEE